MLNPVAKNLTVVITGGRKFDRADLVFDVLDKLHFAYSIKQMFVGGAAGADTLAEGWARRNGISVDVKKAAWHKWGPSAGSRRNTAMLLDAWNFGGDLVLVVFPGGKGTADCAFKASKMPDFTILTACAGYDYVG